MEYKLEVINYEEVIKASAKLKAKNILDIYLEDTMYDQSLEDNEL